MRGSLYLEQNGSDSGQWAERNFMIEGDKLLDVTSLEQPREYLLRPALVRAPKTARGMLCFRLEAGRSKLILASPPDTITEWLSALRVAGANVTFSPPQLRLLNAAPLRATPGVPTQGVTNQGAEERLGPPATAEERQRADTIQNEILRDTRAMLEKEAEKDNNVPSWNIAEWLNTLKTSEAISEGLMTALGDSGTSEAAPQMELSLIKVIGSRADGREIVGRLLLHTLGPLTEHIWAGVRELVEARATTSSELISKFVNEDSAFELRFGGIDTFFKGLEGLIGLPSPNFVEAMYREHCMAEDSTAPFTTGNYQITTTSTVEYHLVAEAESGLAKLNLEAWPMEQDLRAHGDSKNEARQPVAMEVLRKRKQPYDEQLKAVGTSPLVDAELIAGRLYTGPCFIKYNAVLRAFTKSAPMVAAFEKVCLGNRYVTTLHAINSCLVKLSKVMRATKVYRGVKGGALPRELLVPNAHGIRAGVDFAFLSTTLKREVAADYAGHSAATVFEMSMGMVDRGADLSWLSQYPHEQEICFPPLSGLEVLGMRVDGTLLVVEMRVSLNLNALTLEQHVAKMQRSHQQLLSVMIDDLHFMGAPMRSVSQLERLAKAVADTEPTLFNRSDQYSKATTEAIEAQRTVLAALSCKEAWDEDELMAASRPDSNRTIAKRMYNCAEVCARAGHLEHAIALLRLSLQTAPLRDAPPRSRGPSVMAELSAKARAKTAAPSPLRKQKTLCELEEVTITKGDGGGRGRADSGAPDSTLALEAIAGSSEEERWVMEIMYLLLADGALQPWPAVLVELASQHGGRGAATLGTMVSQLLPLDPFVAGAEVVVYKDVGDCWTECAGVVTEPPSAGTLSVRITDDGTIERHPKGRVQFQEKANAGAGALLRAAAEVGSAAVVDALLTNGVSAMLADVSRVNALHLAAQAGHAVVVKALLAMGLDKRFITLGRAGGGGKTAVELAKEGGRADALRALEPRKTDEELADALVEASPLLRAARDGDLPALKEVAPDGGDGSLAAEGGVTALHVAARFGRLELVKWLLEKNSRDAVRAKVDALTPMHGLSALHLAAEEGRTEVARALLAAGAKADGQSEAGWSPLLLAAVYGQTEVARLLLSAAADVNRQISGCTPREWSTPLLAATDALDEPMVRLLLEAKADVARGAPIVGESGSGLDGWFPLMDACQCGAHGLAAILLAAGADPNQQLRGKSTPLYFAGCNGHLECCQLLLQAKAWVDQADTSNGRAPLYWAARYGHAANVRLLLSEGADANKALTSTGRTPLQEASFGGHASIARTLLATGAAINAADNEGDSALHLSAAQGAKPVVQLLLNAGAAPNAPNKAGATPQQIALSQGHEAIAKSIAAFCSCG